MLYKLLILISILIPGTNIIFSQSRNYNCYLYYTLNEFSKQHLIDSMDFYKDMYDHLNYPALAREQDIEEMAEVLIINHSTSDFEIINKNGFNALFEETIIKSINLSHNHWKNTDTKFLLDICIKFSIIGSKLLDSSATCPFEIVDYFYDEWKPQYDSAYFFPSHSLDYPPQFKMNLPFVKYNHEFGDKYSGTKIIGIEDLTQYIQSQISFWTQSNFKITWISELNIQLDEERYLEPNHKSWFTIEFDSVGHLAGIHSPQSPELESIYPYLKQQFDRDYLRPAIMNGKPVQSVFHFRID